MCCSLSRALDTSKLYFIDLRYYDRGNKRPIAFRSLSVGIFPHKGEASQTIRGLDGVDDGGKSVSDTDNSQFQRHSLFPSSLSLSLSLSFGSLSRLFPFLLPRILRDTRSTAKGLKFHRQKPFYDRSPNGSKFRSGSRMYSALKRFSLPWQQKVFPGKGEGTGEESARRGRDIKASAG